MIFPKGKSDKTANIYLGKIMSYSIKYIFTYK